jgi:hypothetical protein
LTPHPAAATVGRQAGGEMDEHGKRAPHQSAAGKAAAERRGERLAAALRDNLARRKAQARGRDEEAAPERAAPQGPAPRGR